MDRSLPLEGVDSGEVVYGDVLLGGQNQKRETLIY